MLKISLNGLWNARIDAEENGLAKNWAAKPLEQEVEVQVPGCLQQLDCLENDFPAHNDMRNGYKGTYFLEKTFEINALKKGEHCRLYLGGVIPSCHIWINGKYVAKNIFGTNHINIDITDFVIIGSNRITVAITEQYDSLVTGMRFAGADWSGIYSEAYVEICGAIQFKNTYVAIKDGKAFLEGSVLNYAAYNYSGNMQISVGINSCIQSIFVKGKSINSFSYPVNIDGLPRWSYRNPQTVKVKISVKDNHGNVTEDIFTTGLREITISDERILFDGKPTFFAGTGSEYYSPTISPLTDRNIIEKRYSALKKHGFNFYRCHTHVPTEEEMCIADEWGIMLDVEFGLVSNFNKTTPFDKGIEMLEGFVLQSRRHPSVVVYALGNEGSQLMVDSDLECEYAKIGYKTIKNNTENQLAIIAFGMQGELPELENDFETPHLWSENFLWSYDGLTDIPWEDLSRTTNGKPCVIHEYGKFGVWPSRKEEKDCTVENGIKPYYGTQAYLWLQENGLENKENTFIENSRKSASSFNRIILEDARRQPYISGYALWTFFRRSGSNAGLSDDLGINFNGDPNVLKNGANADISLLMDRGFQNRAFACNVEQEIRITISNFSEDSINGNLKVSLCSNNNVIIECANKVSIDTGVTRESLILKFSIPAKYSNCKLCLTANLFQNSNSISENKWDFWAFDTAADNNVRAYLNIENLTLFRELKKIFPNAQRLSSIDSIIIGCRSWRNPQLVETALKNKSIPIISDVYDDVIKQCIINGCKVLLLDSGKLPDSWMSPPICDNLGERDTGRFFTSFRAGWDRGNLVTLVESDKILGNFPNNGLCDLCFYDIIQSARTMMPSVIEKTFGKKPKCIVECVSKIPVEKQIQSIVQDKNAVKEQKSTIMRNFNAREQVYLIKVNDNIIVCTLKLSDNPSGIGMIKNIIDNM